MPGLEVIRTINDVVVERGARIRQFTNLDDGPRFVVFGVCIDDAGTRWRGEVELGGRTILHTEDVDSFDAATRDAEEKLHERFIELFAARTGVDG